MRRLGVPALVLAPNSAIQGQWLAAVEGFGPAAAGLAAAEPGEGVGGSIFCLTYQSLARLDDPGDALTGVARGRWAAERARAEGETVEEIERRAVGWTGRAAQRRDREIGRVVATVKREVARGKHPDLELADLLGPGARGRVDALRAGGVGTVVLDECHHLASLWGYVVRLLVEELGDDVHVVGLTATPPDELTAGEAELYEALLGPVDFQVPTPAVVKDGHLAPFQELAWLVEPLAGELAWLREHDARFQELVTTLLDETPDVPHSLAGWVIVRVRDREAGPARSAAPAKGGPASATEPAASDASALADGPAVEATLSWPDFQRRHPRLAAAGVRFLATAGLRLPSGAPRGEAFRRAPDLDDWLVLLEDYVLRCLAADPSPAAHERLEAVRAALAQLGWQLTRRGMRRGAGEVDRLLTTSAAKTAGLVEVLATEFDARGEGLRALVVADSELAQVGVDPELRGVLDPGAGTARAATAAVADDVRTAPLRPLLVTGRGLRCAPGDATALLEALAAQGVEGVEGWAVEEAGEAGLVALSAGGPGWSTRTWVSLATATLTAGATRALVGTRGLLGEGWNAPCVNCLVDLSTVATGPSVRQLRGRSLRLDPDDDAKVASNWDVVCVAPDLARGTADYDRFVRRHRGLHAPTETGEIEAGPSHVHPELGPFAPPAAERFADLNAAMRGRAAAPGDARERWRIGEPYAGEEHRTVVIRPRREDADPSDRRLRSCSEEALNRGPRLRRPGALAGGGVALAVGGTLAGAPLALLAVAALPAAGAWAAARLEADAALHPVRPPLERIAAAVAGAYVALDELRPAAAASLAVEPRSSGFLRCRLREATPQESERFAAALEQALEGGRTARWLHTRRVAVPAPGRWTRLGRALARRPVFDDLWTAVPDDLATHRDRAEAYAAAWRRNVGPTTLLFAHRGEGRDARAAAEAEHADFDVQVREVWV